VGGNDIFVRKGDNNVIGTPMFLSVFDD